jgi:phosphohistidine phosphatase SixA
MGHVVKGFHPWQRHSRHGPGHRKSFPPLLRFTYVKHREHQNVQGNRMRASSVQRLRAVTGGVIVVMLLLATPVRASDPDGLWALLQRGGQVVIMRHAATEPGIGDPPGFRLDACRTQRNLSAVGREQARRLGAAWQTRGVPIGQVLSSRWCRCLETARLAFGTVEPWWPLDSFFQDRSREVAQTSLVRQRVGERPTTGNLILVTHQVNITALTGIAPAAGEMVILTPQVDRTFRLAGRLSPPALVSP